jgi:hypothetical protein
VPVAYILLKIGLPAYSVLIAFVSIEIITCVFRLVFLTRMAGLSIKEYFERVFLKVVIPVFASILVCGIITYFYMFDFRFIVTCVTSVCVFFICIYIVGLCQDEQEVVLSLISRKIHKK